MLFVKEIDILYIIEVFRIMGDCVYYRYILGMFVWEFYKLDMVN